MSDEKRRPPAWNNKPPIKGPRRISALIPVLLLLLIAARVWDHYQGRPADRSAPAPRPAVDLAYLDNLSQAELHPPQSELMYLNRRALELAHQVRDRHSLSPEQTVVRLDLGELNLPGGRIVAAEPFFPGPVPLLVGVSPGRYPMAVFLVEFHAPEKPAGAGEGAAPAAAPESPAFPDPFADSRFQTPPPGADWGAEPSWRPTGPGGDKPPSPEKKAYIDRRVALAAVYFNDQPAVRWEIARVSTEQDPSRLGAGEYFGYGVDGGTGGLMSLEAAQALDRDFKSGQRLITDWVNWTGTVPAMNYALPDSAGLNALVCESGWGDGSYPSYFGFDARGRVACLVTDFQVLGE